jgi:hypothetical protein
MDPVNALVPTVFRWEHGGNAVFITGTFNGWSNRVPMHRSGNDFVYIAGLARGKHAYKFIVDDEWRFAPDQPTVPDAAGNINNVMDLTTFRPDDDTAPLPGGLTRKDSLPGVGYGHDVPDEDEFTKEPPLLPPQLRSIVLNAGSPDPWDPAQLPPPSHVSLNHLNCTAIKDGLMVQAVTQRYRRKHVTTVLYSLMPVAAAASSAAAAALAQTQQGQVVGGGGGMMPPQMQQQQPGGGGVGGGAMPPGAVGYPPQQQQQHQQRALSSGGGGAPMTRAQQLAAGILTPPPAAAPVAAAVAPHLAGYATYSFDAAAAQARAQQPQPLLFTLTLSPELQLPHQLPPPPAAQPLTPSAVSPRAEPPARRRLTPTTTAVEMLSLDEPAGTEAPAGGGGSSAAAGLDDALAAQVAALSIRASSGTVRHAGDDGRRHATPVSRSASPDAAKRRAAGGGGGDDESAGTSPDTAATNVSCSSGDESVSVISTQNGGGGVSGGIDAGVSLTFAGSFVSATSSAGLGRSSTMASSAIGAGFGSPSAAGGGASVTVLSSSGGSVLSATPGLSVLRLSQATHSAAGSVLRWNGGSGGAGGDSRDSDDAGDACRSYAAGDLTDAGGQLVSFPATPPQRRYSQQLQQQQLPQQPSYQDSALLSPTSVYSGGDRGSVLSLATAAPATANPSSCGASTATSVAPSPMHALRGAHDETVAFKLGASVSCASTSAAAAAAAGAPGGAGLTVRTYRADDDAAAAAGYYDGTPLVTPLVYSGSVPGLVVTPLAAASGLPSSSGADAFVAPANLFSKLQPGRVEEGAAAGAAASVTA